MKSTGGFLYQGESEGMILNILETMGYSKCKIKRIATVMMLVILCTACGTEYPVSLLSNVGEISKERPEEKDKETDKKIDVRIIRKLYIYTEQRNEIEIYYPQLSGLEDTAKEKRINTLIEEDVKKVIGEKNKEGDDTLYCINLDFEIKFLNENMLSILYTGRRGYIMPGRARMIGKAIGTTIDIEEEKIITLKDVVTDSPELRDMLLADEFDNITKWEGKAGTFEVSWEYRGYEDKEYELERDLQAEERQWYTDGEHFIVILEEFADYNEYSISNDLVRHILDEEFLEKLG